MEFSEDITQAGTIRGTHLTNWKGLPEHCVKNDSEAPSRLCETVFCDPVVTSATGTGGESQQMHLSFAATS